MYSTAFSTDFPKLEFLSLADNGLKVIPDISALANTLVSLFLERNRITSLKGLYNIRFSRLRVLELMENHINAISIDKLHMPALTTLSLHDNLVKIIEPIVGILGGSSGPCAQLLVSLHDNPWHCYTSMVWLQEFKKVPGMQPTYYTGSSCRVYILDDPTLICKSPLRLKGISLWTAGIRTPFSLKIACSLSDRNFQWHNYPCWEGDMVRPVSKTTITRLYKDLSHAIISSVGERQLVFG